MDLDQLKQILDLVREHELSELEIEQEGLRIRVRREAAGSVGLVALPATSSAATHGAPAPLTAAGVTSTAHAGEGEADESDIELAVVKSPIVGTFYRSPEPGSPPFVDIGSTVKKGQVICIIEAMKLMNEIDSEYDGEVVNAYVESGQPVQYGERLFAIRTR